MTEMKVIKFGGTSLCTCEDRLKVIEILKNESIHKKIIVVVSAMGRFPEPYATDTLLNMSPLLTLKAKDEMMSCGEMISSHVLCNDCLQYGLNCTCLNIMENGIKTDSNYFDGTIQCIDSNFLYQTLKSYQIIIVPGFFGTNRYLNPTSLGRGGSDLSAIAIADSLGLKEVTIYSDVKGIYSADPKLISEAKLYKHVNIQQVLNLANLNVPVIQYKACQYAFDKKIRMILKSTFNPDGYTIVDDKGSHYNFIIGQKDGYYLLDQFNKCTKFSMNLTLNQAHRLFIV